MKIEKTGKIVKVEPSYVVPMWKFVFDFMNWSAKDYLHYIREIRETIKRRPVFGSSHIVLIKPGFLLLPVYRYSRIPEDNVVKRLGIEFKYDDLIMIENLSLFNVYRVIEDADPDVKMEIEVFVGIAQFVRNASRDYIMKAKARVEAVGIEFKTGTEGDSKRHYNGCFSKFNNNRDFFKLYDFYLGTLRWAMGRNYSNFSWRGEESEVLNCLHRIENDMFILVNFLYTLYTGNLKADDTEYNLFKPYVELLQSYGNTFEEVVSTIREVVILTGENF
jgi:hypothetical protein